MHDQGTLTTQAQDELACYAIVGGKIPHPLTLHETVCGQPIATYV